MKKDRRHSKRPRIAISAKETATIILLMLLATFILCLEYFIDRTEKAFQAETSTYLIIQGDNNQNAYTIHF